MWNFLFVLILAPTQCFKNYPLMHLINFDLVNHTLFKTRNSQEVFCPILLMLLGPKLHGQPGAGIQYNTYLYVGFVIYIIGSEYGLQVLSYTYKCIIF